MECLTVQTVPCAQRERIKLALVLVMPVNARFAQKGSINQDWECRLSSTVPGALQALTQQPLVPAQFPVAWFVVKEHFSQAVGQLRFVLCVMLEHINLGWV
jgi:hypothetical protein